MRQIIVLFVLLAFAAVTGCASRNTLPHRVHSRSGRGGASYAQTGTTDPKIKPYSVFGKTYYPLQTAVGYDEVGKASWYGADFHGNKTANGQIYNMYGVSAAHKTLPLGTTVCVTNLENNRSVNLMINDRGPFVKGRILDLSYGAAKRLGAVEKGVIPVRVAAIGSTPRRGVPQKTASSKPLFNVRVGAFAVRANAETTYEFLRSKGYHEARIKSERRNGILLHIVQAGSYLSRDTAEHVQASLKPDFPTCYIVH